MYGRRRVPMDVGEHGRHWARAAAGGGEHGQWRGGTGSGAGQVAIDDGAVRVALTATQNFGILLASPQLLAWSLAVFGVEGGSRWSDYKAGAFSTGSWL
jgi:hypothetical protein